MRPFRPARVGARGRSLYPVLFATTLSGSAKILRATIVGSGVLPWRAFFFSKEVGVRKRLRKLFTRGGGQNQKLRRTWNPEGEAEGQRIAAIFHGGAQSFHQHPDAPRESSARFWELRSRGGFARELQQLQEVSKSQVRDICGSYVRNTESTGCRWRSVTR